MKNITKIVLTGGPCSGKTTAIEKISLYFKQKGYSVFVVSEPATELILSGITPNNVENFSDFEDGILKIHLFKENLISNYISENRVKTSDKILIICDRGIFDIKAYVTDDLFSKLLEKNNLTRQNVLSRYDAVFHLVTTANGAEEFYTTANNKARTEGVEEARKLDEKTADSWGEHKKLNIIDNSTGFDGKIDRLISAIELTCGI